MFDSMSFIMEISDFNSMCMYFDKTSVDERTLNRCKIKNSFFNGNVGTLIDKVRWMSNQPNDRN